MKRSLGAVLLLAFAACRHTQFEQFPATVESTRTALKIPALSVAVVRDGEIVFARGFGDASENTLYPIGSITKTFTATLMQQLAEEGRLDLDAEVRGFVDWEVAPGIRIQHVLSHISEDVPGTRFAYSSRFNWLDNVVEAATKESFRTLMTKRVLEPANLRNTHLDQEHEGYAESLPNLAIPHRVDASGNVVRSQYPPMGFHSSSGMASTVTDLARYSIALDEGRLLPPAALERMWTPRMSAQGKVFPYASGWFAQTVAGERVVWHTSWWPDAYSGLLVKVPSRKLALVLLANTDRLVSPQRGASNVLLYPIANAFLQSMLGRDAAFRGTGLVAQALTTDDATRRDALLAQAIACCTTDLVTISDEDRLRLFADSNEPTVRALAVEAGQRLAITYPETLGIQFDVALLHGRVRPSMRINGADAPRAVAALEKIVASTKTKPKWMDAWSHYLVAEQIAATEPARAKTLADRALAMGVDTDGLRGRIEELLRKLQQ